MAKTYKELLAEKRGLDARIAVAQDAERGHALATIRDLMAQFSIGAEELVAKVDSRRGPQPAKYRDPASGATWSGRGREPSWLAGKDRTAFAI
jgi:DNA-binding protein H-NS